MKIFLNSKAYQIFFLALLIISITIPLWHFAIGKTQVLPPIEVKIAFWAWRNKSPNQVEVDKAIHETNPTLLFLRLGQFDYGKRRIKTIRRVEGELPEKIEIHFVNNATQSLLRSFENIDTMKFAKIICETFKQDLKRSKNRSADTLYQ